MKVSNRQGKVLQKAIASWQQEGTLSAEEADRLSKSFTIQSFDWKKLAKYSFWIAIVCGLISVAAKDVIYKFQTDHKKYEARRGD